MQNRVIMGAVITATMLFIGAVAIQRNNLDEQSQAASERRIDIARCEDTIKKTNQYSLVLTDINVRDGLECAEKYPQFQSFKALFDERSPNSPLKKADN